MRRIGISFKNLKWHSLSNLRGMEARKPNDLQIEAPNALSQTFRVIVFDWDGTAVPDRSSDSAPLVEILEGLLMSGVTCVIISGTHFGNIYHQCLHHLAISLRTNVFVCTNRGSEVFSFDESGNTKLLQNRVASQEENKALDKAAEELKEFLEKQNVKSEILYNRLNRRKVDLIPLKRWENPKKAEFDLLLKEVQIRLRNAGVFGGLKQVIQKAYSIAIHSGLAFPKITSDVKHIEIGLTDKSDSIRWVKDHLLLNRRIPFEDVVFVGDEFGEIGGVPGSDSLMQLPELTSSVYISVGVEPNGVPPGVIHCPGGPLSFLKFLEKQIEKMPCFEVLSHQDSNWLIEQDGFDPSQEDEIETLFALGNGYLGVRGTSDFLIPNSQADVFLAGVYDQKVEVLPYSEIEFVTKGRKLNPFSELVPFPSPFPFKVSVDGLKLTAESPDLKKHHRYFDLKHAVLLESWYFQDPRGRETQIKTMRWVSLANFHLLFQEIELLCINHTSQVSVDLKIENVDIDLQYPHLKLTRPVVQSYDEESFLFETKVSHLQIALVSRILTEHPFLNPTKYSFLGKSGEPIKIRKWISIVTTRDGNTSDLETQATNLIDSLKWNSYSTYFLDHIRKWRKFWEIADIQFLGNPELTQTQRFNLYHLRISADHDPRISIGARALVGRAYEGHIFWDTEIFVLPFFIHLVPEVARNLLLYRHETLQGAKRRAEQMGYRGACYAWESTVTGDDVTPEKIFLKATQKEVPVFTGSQQIHVTADIAYGIWYYWSNTDDHDFMMNYGAEILVETARFWESRVIQKNGTFQILDVVGPDEYHHNIHNNAYTNWMAKFNLQQAARVINWMRKFNQTQFERFSSQMSLKINECEVWEKIAENLYFPQPNKDGVIEQFQGFFKLNKVNLKQNELLKAPIDRLFFWEQVNSQQLIKQADVLMIPFLFPHAFPREIIQANYEYYEPRTDHGSSLSPSIHAAIAARINRWNDIKKYWNLSVHLDLLNLMKNTSLGVHLANIGGAWQALVFHILGIKINHGQLEQADLKNGEVFGNCSKILLNLIYKNQCFHFDIQNREKKSK